MKKFLHFTAVFAIGIFTLKSYAQLPDGSTAPDFTFTDMNGNSQNLYTYLNAGKVVVLDVSATWCGPCWNYHQTNALKNFYNQYGPPGTNQAMVLWVEGDGNTNNACMTNSSGCTGGTQGNWVSGTPYPMCNPPSGSALSSFLSGYQIAYYPTMYLICPDKTTTKVDQYTTTQLYNTMMSKCPPPTAPNDAGVSAVSSPGSFACGTSFTPVVTIRNYGSSPLTSCTINYQVDANPVQTYNWTGNLASLATTQVTLPSITVALGTHTFTSSTSNPNGVADGNTVNDQKTTIFNAVSNMNLPYTEGIQNTLPSSNIGVDNPDNSTTWTKSTPGGFGNSSHSAKMDCYNYATTGEKDYLIIPPMDFSSSSSLSMTFNVAYRPYNATYYEKLDVEISTDCGNSWTNVYSKQSTVLATASASTSAFTPTSSQWRTETINLNTYAGQASVMARFICTNGYGNNLYIDDINISGTTGEIDKVDISKYISIFPSPTNGNVYINISSAITEDVNLKVINALGEVVSEKAKISSKEINLDLSENPSGMYFIEVTSSEGMSIQKIMLNK